MTCHCHPCRSARYLAASPQPNPVGAKAADQIVRRLVAALTLGLALAAIVGLSGCGDKMESRPDTASGVKVPVGKFHVERVGKFRDDIAYGGERGIYIVRDDEQGREWIGVSGIGVAERSAHTQTNGKTATTVSDER